MALSRVRIDMGAKADRFIFKAKLLAGVAILGATATMALAQDATELQPVIIQGGGAGNAAGNGAAEATGIGPVNGYVAKNTTTGSKIATPIIDIPQSVSVIG